MVSNTNMAMHYRGMEDDTKPTSAPNGSDFLEMDTGKIWYFDAENSEWVDPTATDDNNADG